MDKLSKNSFFTSKPWFENNNSIWMFTSFELHRNLKNHFFPHKLEAERIQALSDMLAQALLSLPHQKKNQVISTSDLNPHEKLLLYEYYFPKRDFSQFRNGELFILDPAGHSHSTLNMEDHLHLCTLDTTEDLEKTWTGLLKLESDLAKNLEFSYSSKFGFVTSDPTKCGTALILQTVLHLPALIHLNLIEDKIQNINQNFVDIQGFGGEVEKTQGDLVFLSNRQTLGLSEETLLKNMRRLTLELIVAEQSAREQLKKQDQTPLLDKVGKAYGVLRHSSTLSLPEALSNLSLCKLGIELDWIQGISPQEMNVLFFTVRKGYLKYLFPDYPEDSLDKKRSEYIHNKIDLMQLVD